MRTRVYAARSRPSQRWSCGVAVLLAGAMTPSGARADDSDPDSLAYGGFRASEQVSPFQGSFGYSIPIQAPAFRGLEPKLALAYSSEGGNGTLGVGWSLAGLSTIERASAGRGTPRFDASDVFLFGGEELVPCGAGVTSPSCTSGGTHTAKSENYLEIRFDSAANTWTVWAKDGTRTVLSPTLQVAAGALRWGQTSAIDTSGNVVSSNWTCQDGDCYPASISYAGYEIIFHRELRPDMLTFGARDVVGQTAYRFRSVFVRHGSQPIRAYKLSYRTSPLTGRSLLISVQQYGKDVAADGAGAITGGTALPPYVFSYQEDPSGRSFQTWGGPAPAPSGTVEDVGWTKLVNAEVTAAGLQKNAGGSAWNGGASSTRSLAWGDGYVEFTARTADVPQVVGLSNGDTDATPEDVDFALKVAGAGIYALENGTAYGPWPFTEGDHLRVAIVGGVVNYKRNSTVLRTSTRRPSYPLVVDTSLYYPGRPLRDVVLSGAVQDALSPCDVFRTGDFNGDGRTDTLCYTRDKVTKVALAGPTGFTAPATWLTGADLQIDVWPLTGDFDADGKTDLAIWTTWGGEFQVALSTGTGFSSPTSWGTASVSGADGQYACRIDPAFLGVGDFNGDGRPDVWCKLVTRPQVFVGLSTGTAFNFRIFGQATGGRIGATDFTGDGKDDLYELTSDGVNVYPSDGARFTGGFGGLATTFCDGARLIFGDLNGDGRVDAACMYGQVALSTGKAFVYQGNYGSWCPTPLKDFFAADVDGDGQAEMLCNNKDAGTDDIQVRKWTPLGLSPAQTWKANWCPGRMLSGDFNGDGKSDLYCSGLATPVAIGGTDGRRADLLATAGNGIGGTAQVAYTQSTLFVNANNPGVRYAVTALTTDDGRGGTATSTYAYSGGLLDRQERRFLGFRSIKQTLPCIAGETACPTAETWLKQDLPSAGKPERIVRTDGAGNWLASWDYTYATNGDAIPRKSLLSSETSSSFDGSGSNPCPAWPCLHGRRASTSHQYDSYGNTTLTVAHGDADEDGDELATVWAYEPDPGAYIVGRPSLEQRFAGVDSGGTKLAETRFTYDARGLLTESSRWLDTASRYVTRSFGYDSWGNRISENDETNRTTTFAYDTTQHLFVVSTTNAAGEAWRAEWDAVCGLPTVQTDSNGQRATTQSDGLCRPARVDRPLGGFAVHSFRNLGDPATQHVRLERPSASPEDGTGNDYVATYFDGSGRTYRTVRKGPAPAREIIRDTHFNARGGIASRSAPYYSGDATQATSYAYDALDRLTETRHRDGSLVTSSYEPWIVTTRDEHGHPVATLFDAYGQVASRDERLDGRGRTTRYAYDGLGRLTGMVDALGHSWGWSFDSLGRLLSRNDPDAGVWSYDYDDAGRDKSRTDAKGQCIELRRDLAGRVTQRSGGDLTTTLSHGEARSGYFNHGRLTTVHSPGDVLRVDYDAAGRLVRAARTLDGVEHVGEQRYDAAGLLRGMTYPDGDAVGTSQNPIRYDAAGRLRSVPGIVTQTLYDAAGRLTQQTNANGTATTRTYTPERGFLTHITTQGGSAIVQDLAYSVDPGGLITETASPFAHESWAYSYDDLHRLTAATSLTSPEQSQSFAYDDVGRITYNSRVGDYTYPSPGAPRVHAPSAVAGSPYEYDANGNLVSGGGRQIGWNVDNLPVQIDATHFTYDGLGTRLKSTGSTASLYPLGDDYEITNGVIIKYVALPGLGVVAKRVGSATFWLHGDRLGSIQAITDAAGSTVQRRAYRPYGDRLADTSTHRESRGYIDQRQDEETRLTYLHARYYDPALGLFLSPDSLSPTLPRVGSNRYAYGLSNPITWSDRSGHISDNDGCSYSYSETIGPNGMPSFDEIVTCASPNGGTSMPGSNTGLKRSPRAPFMPSRLRDEKDPKPPSTPPQTPQEPETTSEPYSAWEAAMLRGHGASGEDLLKDPRCRASVDCTNYAIAVRTAEQSPTPARPPQPAGQDELARLRSQEAEGLKDIGKGIVQLSPADAVVDKVEGPLQILRGLETLLVRPLYGLRDDVAKVLCSGPNNVQSGCP